MPQVLNISLTARHMLEALANKLYRDFGACILELVRNSVVAYTGEDHWNPKLATVEINLYKNHPLSQGVTAIEVFDRGCGIPMARLEKIGPGLNDQGSSHGASQNRAGRFAALALNEKSAKGDVNSGFYILTRTTKNGPVKMVSMIPAMLERGDPTITDIDSDSIELGPRRGTKGSFTSVVIPNSVFATEAEIRDALSWKIPRNPDLMFKLLIGGKELTPPKLATDVTLQSESGDIKVFIGRCPDGDGGIWFTDAQTGFRVAYAPSFHPKLLPEPLWRRDLEGDIFVPGLLKSQDLSRSGLSTKFFKSKQWEKVYMYLIGQVASKARNILGNETVFNKGTAANQAVLDFVDLCNQAYGPPSNGDGPIFDVVDDFNVKIVKKPGKGHGDGHGGGGGGGHGGGTRVKPDNKTTDVIRTRKPRVIPIKIGDDVFFLSKMPMDERTLAIVDPNNGTVILLNSDRYCALPTRKDARLEHLILMILMAIGRHKFEADPEQMIMWIAERRGELLKKSS